MRRRSRTATLTAALILILALPLALPVMLCAADGDLDTGFSSDGQDIQDWGVDFTHALAVAAAADGSILVGGQVKVTSMDFGVVRYGADGSVDTAFGEQGFTRVPFDVGDNEGDSLRQVLTLPGGKSLLIGTVETATVFLPGVARLTAGGDLDTDFGTGGKIVLDVLPDTNTSVFIEDAVRQPDGKVVLLGTSLPPGGFTQGHLFLLRIDEDGAPDLTFSSDGWTLLDIPSATAESGAALELDDLGRIHIAANALAPSSYRPVYLRVGTTGLVEVVNIVDFGELWVASDLALDPPTWRPILSLRDNDANFDAGLVIRLDTAGEIDSTFGDNGFAEMTLEEGSWMGALAVQSDRKIVLAGHIDHTGSQKGGFLLARLLPDGARDNSFDGNGVVRYEFDRDVDARDGASALALAGGRLVAAGYAGIGAFNDRAFAVLRTRSALIFTDGFERASTSAWLGN